ncbi:hypothetical protein C5E45_23580 [Nocardia nova]|uniref:HTH cro/C1-type domain-containing protein n=1 Tax=Nocardia nova TaxID=37330 RepID=A0A2S6AKQ2_9NOCA|nr:hypothetical protein [Nocardia nova]PPJ35800.1 hypothetical protein C5E45_23580 [Nocardia nova]
MQQSQQHPLTRAFNILVNAMHPPTSGEAADVEISNRALAEDIRAATGMAISPNGLWKLRTGQTVNPSVDTLEVLRHYFGLQSLDPLTDPVLAAKYAQELRLLKTLKGQQDTPTFELLLRSGLEDGTVPPSAIASLLEILQRITAEQSGGGGEKS